MKLYQLISMLFISVFSCMAIANPVELDDTQKDALYLAIRTQDNAALAKMLVPDVELNFIKKVTPLTLAIRKDNVEAATMLLEHGADVNFGIGKITPPLLDAIRSNNMEMFNLVFEKTNDVNLKGTRYPNLTPLMQAARMGYTPMVEKLLTKEIDLDVVCVNGIQALGYAAQIDNNEVIIQQLIDKGAILNHVSFEDFTPLDYAESFPGADSKSYQFIASKGGKSRWSL